jgi:hypothetical protein
MGLSRILSLFVYSLLDVIDDVLDNGNSGSQCRDKTSHGKLLSGRNYTIFSKLGLSGPSGFEASSPDSGDLIIEEEVGGYNGMRPGSGASLNHICGAPHHRRPLSAT